MQIPVSEIKPPENTSYDPDELSKLKESIRVHGLFHAIMVKGDGAPYEIVTGRARFLCVKSLIDEGSPFSGIEAVISNAENAHEMQLHENLRRHNLPWYESVELEKELHDLRVQQHGKKRDGRPTPEDKGWSQNDTARELGLSLGGFSQDMALATELQRNPNLRNVKDKTTAIKLIKNIVKRQTAEILHSLPDENVTNECLLGDSLDVLKNFPDSTFDLCVTDPPWSEYNDESLTADQKTLLPIFKEVYRTLKKDSIMFMVTSTTDFYFYLKELPKLGFKIQSYPLIWHKLKNISHGLTSWQFMRDYEPIIVAAKGDPSLTTGNAMSSVLPFDMIHVSKCIHPHEKPIELIRKLLIAGSHSGAKVLDPFAGSGVTLEACIRNDREFIGIEKNKEFFEAIQRRLQDVH